MTDIFSVIHKWWKLVLVLVLISVGTAAVIVFLKPTKYRAVSTAVPASSYATDKAAIFSENIQALYSSLGEADDLDRVLGLAALDTVYYSVAKEIDLASHYKLNEEGDERTARAAKELKKHTRVSKSEYGELKVKTLDKDKNAAARFSNAVMQKLQLMQQDLYSKANQVALEGLRAGRDKLLSDSARGNPVPPTVEKYDKLISEYQLMVDTKPPALIVTEHAKPPLHAHSPRRKMILAGVAVLSLIFSFLVIYVIEAAKSRPS